VLGLVGSVIGILLSYMFMVVGARIPDGLILTMVVNIASYGLLIGSILGIIGSVVSVSIRSLIGSKVGFKMLLIGATFVLMSGSFIALIPYALMMFASIATYKRYVIEKEKVKISSPSPSPSSSPSSSPLSSSESMFGTDPNLPKFEREEEDFR
jgi:hypothetical protein